ncbi:phage tail protein [Streptomyces sp. NPDC004111]|uniref:phage tail protein n=1 Tax=Streptomyces sp. NPDC004111 TaxID=3364690 RepID=UPI0036BC2E2A
MQRSTGFPRRRTAGVATAALLSLALLTACGGGSSDSGSAKSDSSPTSAPSGDASAKGAKNPAQEGARTNPDAKVESKDGLQSGDQLTAHNFALEIGGGTAEYLQEVTGLATDQNTEETHSVTPDGREFSRKIPGQQQAGSVTVVRGASRSEQFDGMINGSLQPESITIAMLDFQNAPVKRYHLKNPRVVKVDMPAGGGPEQVTIQFAELTIG